MGWRITGSYLEACNCEAICPCRRIGGRTGGRSSYGECLGALSWMVREGQVNGTDMAERLVVLTSRYHDDEPGSPWTFALFVDAKGTDKQRRLLADVFTGRLGGAPMKQFPWAFKASTLLGVDAAEIEIDHTPGRGWFKAGGSVEVRIREPFGEQEAVTCVIPGHQRSGRELISDSIDVETDGLSFSVKGRCAYEATFDYSSDAHK